jgi:hypothetical protein
VEFKTKSIPKIKQSGPRIRKVKISIGTNPIISPGRTFRTIREYLIPIIVKIETMAKRKYQKERFFKRELLEIAITFPSLLPNPTHKSQTQSRIPRHSSLPEKTDSSSRKRIIWERIEAKPKSKQARTKRNLFRFI